MEKVFRKRCEQNLSHRSCTDIDETAAEIRSLNIFKNPMDFSKAKE